MAWVGGRAGTAARPPHLRAPGGREAAEAVEVSSTNGYVSDESGVRAWLAALPERQRLAVYLRYYADLDYRAIAVALGVEVGTVSATLSSALQALRRSLEEVER